MLDKLKAWILNRKIATVIAALVLIPYFAFQSMHERKAAESKAQTVHLDSGVSVEFDRDDYLGTVVYKDGTRLPRDGLALLVLTYDAYVKTKDAFRWAGGEPKQESFPLVLFFNATGFDVTGQPIAVRSAANGKSVLPPGSRTIRAVRLAISSDDGSVRIIDCDGREDSVSAEVWKRDYAPDLPVDAKPEDKKPEASGLRGVVARIGGLAAVQPVAASIIVFRGSVNPSDYQAALKDRVAATAQSAADGKFEIGLPAGTYTVIASIDGKVYGNAVNQAVWPTIVVENGWVDYDFRLAAR